MTGPEGAQPHTALEYLELALKLIDLTDSAGSIAAREKLLELSRSCEMLAGSANSISASGIRQAALASLARRFEFHPAAIETVVPPVPGLFVLWRHTRWIYLGIAENLRARLMALAGDDEACSLTEPATAFGFELIEANAQQEVRRTKLLTTLADVTVS
jgi:hypothetical protein